jgi:hypothetical protein
MALICTCPCMKLLVYFRCAGTTRKLVSRSHHPPSSSSDTDQPMSRSLSARNLDNRLQDPRLSRWSVGPALAPLVLPITVAAPRGLAARASGVLCGGRGGSVIRRVAGRPSMFGKQMPFTLRSCSTARSSILSWLTSRSWLDTSYFSDANGVPLLMAPGAPQEWWRTSLRKEHPSRRLPV